MKKSQALILLTSLAVSSVVLANTSGSVPKCTSGRLNMEVYVKDIDSCPDDKGHAEYCIYDMWSSAKGDHGTTCEDFEDLFYKNDNESFSVRAKPSFCQIQHLVGSRINGKIKNQKLRFTYDHGAISDNCDQVFGSDVQCVITKSGDSKHPLYKLTISKR